MPLRKLRSKAVELYAVGESSASFDAVTAELDIEFEDGSWSQVNFADARKIFASGEGAVAEFALIAVEQKDEPRLKEISALVAAVKECGLPVILLAKDISPMLMHALLKAGADDFVPSPPPQGALTESIEKLRVRHDGPVTYKAAPQIKRKGLIYPVYGVAGGVGATTFAVNLAWELALATRKSTKRVCLLDFNFQYGSVSTYLDLPRHDSTFELLSDPAGIDANALANALTSFNKRLAVLTAPTDSVPYDIVGPEDVKRLLELAQQQYDFIVVDVPQTLVSWTETLLNACETFFVTMEIDMRSAQNMLRFLRTLKAEELPLEKIEVVLNRAPRFTDMSGRNRAKRMAESLGVEFRILLPDGGRQVMNCCDQGAPLAEQARSNPLRKEVKRVSASILEAADAASAAVI